jgi:hypothetical protein
VGLLDFAERAGFFKSQAFFPAALPKVKSLKWFNYWVKSNYGNSCAWELGGSALDFHYKLFTFHYLLHTPSPPRLLNA